MMTCSRCGFVESSGGISPREGASASKGSKGANWEFYEPPQNISPAEFCGDTSLHGLQYLSQPERHLIERIFWLVAFIGAVTSAGLLIYKLLDNHINSPVETVFTGKELPIENIPFPAVTICNVNNIKLSKYYEYDWKVRQFYYLQNETYHNRSSYPPLNYTEFKQAYAALVDAVSICDSKTFASRIVNNKIGDLEKFIDGILKSGAVDMLKGYQQYHNPTKIVREGSQSCKDMILFCMWRHELVDCDQLFYEVETDYGSCCTFNTIPLSLLDTYFNDSRDHQKRVEGWENADLSWDNLIFTEDSKDRKYPRRQKYPGMAGGLTVLLNPELHEWFCSDIDSEGFAVGVNGPLDRPRMKDTGLLVKTDSEIFINVRPEITMSDESIRDIDIRKRNCFFGSEKPLPHYSKYTASNCLDECIANRTLAECQCVMYFMPRRDTDAVCNPSKYNCSDVIRNDIMEEGLAEACSECLPTCTEIKYRTEVTALNIQKGTIGRIFEAYPELKNQSANVSIVHVYFGVDSTYPRMRKEVYSKIDLISNTGGLLGLCMGFSMLSLLEIVYYCTLRLCCRYRRKHLEKVGRASFNAADEEDVAGRGTSFKQNWLSTLFARSSDDNKMMQIQDDDVFTIVRHPNPKHHFISPSSSTLRKKTVGMF